jgi:hypothetical protein
MTRHVVGTPGSRRVRFRQTLPAQTLGLQTARAGGRPRRSAAGVTG